MKRPSHSKGRLLFATLIVLGTVQLTHAAQSDPVARGRYIAVIGGCNDCHTAGYIEANGDIPEQQWLTGSKLGWHGPWGTTYPPNLRNLIHSLSEAQWLHKARTLETRPPMPWFAVRQMSDDDLKALYAFIRKLGPAGEPAPAYLPPDQTPPPPYVQFP